MFDCTKAERVARDHDAEGAWEDLYLLEAAGIGPLEGLNIRTAGLFGGALPKGTSDGWTAEALYLEWPEPALLLTPPGSWLYENRAGRRRDFVKVPGAVGAELRAWGFSPTGRTLILATASDLTVFSRNGD